MRTKRTFDAYNNSDAKAQTAIEQAQSLAYNEVGQNWQFMLTLRLPKQNADRLLLQTLEDYFAFLELELQKDVKRRKERVLRSVYVHRGGNDYHAHVYSKYPRNLGDWQKPLWELQLLKCWYKTSALRGHCATNAVERSFLYHFQQRYTNTHRWGAYGIKQNTGDQAWIDDLSTLHYSMNRAIRNGISLSGPHAR